MQPGCDPRPPNSPPLLGRVLHQHLRAETERAHISAFRLVVSMLGTQMLGTACACRVSSMLVIAIFSDHER